MSALLRRAVALHDAIKLELDYDDGLGDLCNAAAHEEEDLLKNRFVKAVASGALQGQAAADVAKALHRITLLRYTRWYGRRRL